MPRYGWFPDGYFVHHDLGTLENLLNRTTFPGAHGTRPGVDHQAGVAELFRLIAVTAGIAEDDAWDLGAMFLTNELDGILCMNDIEMMYFDQQQRRYVYNDFSPLQNGAFTRLFYQQEHNLFGWGLSSWAVNGNILSQTFPDPNGFPRHMLELARVKDSGGTFFEPLLRATHPGRPFERPARGGRPESELSQRIGIFKRTFFDPANRQGYTGWPAGAAAPPANADTPPLYTPEAVVADLPWILFYDLYHDTAAQMETNAKQDIADNLMDWVRRFLEYCIKNSHATANMHPADRKILLDRLMCLLCPAGVKSCLGFFVMIFSSAYIHEGMDYPNDPDPNKVNARNVIANLYIIVRFWLQAAVIDNPSVQAWDPAVEPNTDNLSNRTYAGFWGWALTSSAYPQAPSLVRPLIRYMARIVPKPVKAPFWWAVKETEIRVLPRPKGYDAGYIPITGNTAARILAFLAHPPFVNMLKGHGVLPQGFLGPHIPNCIARIDARTKTAAPFVNSTGPDKLPLTTLVKLRNFVLAFLVDISQDRSITVTRLPTNHAQYRSNPIGILIKKGNADRGGRSVRVDSYRLMTDGVGGGLTYFVDTANLSKTDKHKKRRVAMQEELGLKGARRPPLFQHPPDPVPGEGFMVDMTRIPITPAERWARDEFARIGIDDGQAYAVHMAWLEHFENGPPGPMAAAWDGQAKADMRRWLKEGTLKIRGRAVRFVRGNAAFSKFHNSYRAAHPVYQAAIDDMTDWRGTMTHGASLRTMVQCRNQKSRNLNQLRGLAMSKEYRQRVLTQRIWAQKADGELAHVMAGTNHKQHVKMARPDKEREQAQGYRHINQPAVFVRGRPAHINRKALRRMEEKRGNPFLRPADDRPDAFQRPECRWGPNPWFISGWASTKMSKGRAPVSMRRPKRNLACMHPVCLVAEKNTTFTDFRSVLAGRPPTKLRKTTVEIHKCGHPTYVSRQERTVLVPAPQQPGDSDAQVDHVERRVQRHHGQRFCSATGGLVTDCPDHEIVEITGNRILKSTIPYLPRLISRTFEVGNLVYFNRDFPAAVLMGVIFKYQCNNRGARPAWNRNRYDRGAAPMGRWPGDPNYNPNAGVQHDDALLEDEFDDEEDPAGIG